jgi:hypothetical protein
MLREVSLGLLALVVGCGDNKAESGPRSSNNSATLGGATVGTNAASAADLRRVIPVSATGAGFEVGSGYVTRPDAAASNVYLTVPVKNTAAGLRCAIRATSIAWQDAGGQSLTTTSTVTSLAGSVGQNGASVASTCLAPKETGYLVGLDTTTTLFGSAARVVVALSAEDQGWTAPKAAVVPTSYSSSGTSLVVNYTNSGTAAATVLGSSRYILLDDVGPIGWGFLSSNIVPAGPLAPGQSGSSSDATFTFAGRATGVRAFIAFQDG